MKKAETLLTQFWLIIYVTSGFNFHEENRNFIVQFWAIIYITSEFRFSKKKKKKKDI